MIRRQALHYIELIRLSGLKAEAPECKGFFRFALLLVFIYTSSETFSQTLKREAISSSGSGTSDNGIIYRQTVGQPFNTVTNQTNSTSYRPGFQQPIFALENVKADLSINVYPNPATYFINLSSQKAIENVKITVNDATGKLVYVTSLDELLTFTIDCSKWANGAYFINVSNNNKSFTAKLVLYK